MTAPTIRRAKEADLAGVVRLFALPDEGVPRREDVGPPLPRAYREAFAIIDADPNNVLVVADVDERIAGVFQLTFIQYIANMGSTIAQIENVVVDPEMRGRKIGEAMMRWAIDEARKRRCRRVQLTTNKVRKRAHVFYERLGFVATHEGMKLVL